MTYTNNENKGLYKVKNPHKYRGDLDRVIWRSNWERLFMVWCDKRENILEWGSEEIVVPYVSPIDNRIHRYFVDFYVKIRSKDGNTQKYWVEIKPYQFTQKPQTPKRKTRHFLNEVMTWGINQAKWKSATKHAKDNNAKFLLLTEYDLGFKQHDK